MLSDHLQQRFEERLGYPPTAGQRRLFESFAGFMLQPETPGVLLIKGFSGTGKTTALKSVTEVLDEEGVSSVLMAPTGRAAKVLSAYTGRDAFTIHKKIYRQRSAKDGFGKFELSFNKTFQTFYIVDEASMIPHRSAEQSIFGTGNLLDDLFSYVFGGNQCKLVLIGDMAQLPPVGLEISPALDRDYLRRYGFPVTEVFLDEVVRQEAGSGILHNATLIRQKITTGDFNLPLFEINAFPDIERITGDILIELLEDYYSDRGDEEAVIIVRSNRMANKYNEGIRRQILFREDVLERGDRVMVVKNNYYWAPEGEVFIANGDIFEITGIIDVEERYGYRFADVTLTVPGSPESETEAKVILDTLSADAPALTQEQNKSLFYAILEEDPAKRKTRKVYDRVRNDPYFNALQIKFAYAVTCHKAQGGQWRTVFLDQGYVARDRMNIEYFRWMYTALTRSMEKVYLINFSDPYFT